MNKLICNTIILLSTTVSLAMLKVPGSSLVDSTRYDVGLTSDYQVDWNSDETRAFIFSLKNKKIVVDVEKQELRFVSATNVSYSYPIETAKNKFRIMEINVKNNKSIDYILRCLFLNIDINCDFTKSKKQQKIRQCVKSIYGYDDKDLCIFLWKQISEKLRTHRTNLKKAFDQGEISDIDNAFKEPLYVDHVDLEYIIKELHKK